MENHKKYQFILFDWDGTLAETLDVWFFACITSLDIHGISNISEKELLSGFGNFEHLLKSKDINNQSEILQTADKIAKEKLPGIEIYPDALIVLEELYKRNTKIAIITHAPRKNVEYVLNKYNLVNLFSSIITSDDNLQPKPHPESIEESLLRLGAEKEQAIMVGDSASDIKVAHNGEIDCVLFYPPEHSKFYKKVDLEKMNPTFIISSLQDLLGIIW